MLFIIVGVLTSISALAIRAQTFPSRRILLASRYWILLIQSLLGTCLACVGFYQLATVLPAPVLPVSTNMPDYGQVLTVLSLLATAIVTGFFGE
ncbi:MAG: hypothetical protein ACK5D9_02310 [Burkholderiales bacterium]